MKRQSSDDTELLRLVKAVSEKDERRKHPVPTSVVLTQVGRVV